MTNSDSDGKVRLRNLSDDLKARIKRGEAEEARLCARVATAKKWEEELRVQRGELAMWREMLKMTDVPPEDRVPREADASKSPDADVYE